VDEDEHFKFIKNFSNNYHRVMTAIWVARGRRDHVELREYVESTKVYFCDLSDDIIRSYVQTFPENRFSH